MREKAAAFLELIGVFVIGTLGARYLARALGVGAAGIRDLPPGQPVDFLSLAMSTAANLLLRYGFILGLAFAIGWWHRRRRLRDYGVTMAGMPLHEHLLIALVLFCVGGFLPRFILFLKDYLKLQGGPAHWDLIAPQPTLGYWLYMAAGSYLLVPIAEELFARGYVQTRLGEDFGPRAALAVTALMFTLSHRQYFIASAVGIGMLLSLLFSSIAGGYVRYRYGTLLPVIVAHALGNVPVRRWQVPLLAVMLMVILAAQKPIAAHLRDAFRLVKSREVLAPMLALVVIFALVLGIAAVSRPALLILSVAALGAAIALERRPSHQNVKPTLV